MTAPRPPVEFTPTPGDRTPTASAGTSALERYFRDSLGSTTEAALKEAAHAAGHSQAAIDAAWAATQSQRPSSGGRAVQWILIAYGATFALLSAGMLLNSSVSRGGYMPNGVGGVTVLAISLGAVLLASMVWLASRRVFWSILALLGLLSGVGSLAYSPAQAIALIGGAIGILWVVWRRDWRELGTRADIGILLAVPIVLLVGVAGICLASGLPFPASSGR